MPRSAESTIKGFLYQFHKTGLTILNADDGEEITIEGIVEDIDVEPMHGSTTAIQCKYHEAVENYIPSLIFKPLLQMAEHDSKNTKEPINYIIFIHTSGCEESTRKITEEELDLALGTSNKDLVRIKNRIVPGHDKESFLSRTYIEFGPSILEIETQLKDKLKDIPSKNLDIDYILYPNAIHLISQRSSENKLSGRKITRSNFINNLVRINKAAITRWTLALRDHNKILLSKRNQLSRYLQQNCRERRFHFVSKNIDNFNENLVVFIISFLSQYHHKVLHQKTPLFSIDLPIQEIQEIEERLYAKNIKSNTGIIGKKFDRDHFFRDPMIQTNRHSITKREFDIRLLSFSDYGDALNYRKGDDLFYIGEHIDDCIDIKDTMISILGVSTLHSAGGLNFLQPFLKKSLSQNSRSHLYCHYH